MFADDDVGLVNILIISCYTVEIHNNTRTNLHLLPTTFEVKNAYYKINSLETRLVRLRKYSEMTICRLNRQIADIAYI